MKIKNLILGAIIAIVFLFFCIYGLSLVYDEPKVEDYCNKTAEIPRPVKLPTECTNEEAINQLNQQCYNEGGQPVPIYDSSGCQVDITCDYCRQDYNEARESYSKNIFIISIIFSLVIIIISALLIKIESVSGGLMLGSLMFIIYGTVGYWEYTGKLLRFIILGISLLILIYIGYWLSKREK